MNKIIISFTALVMAVMVWFFFSASSMSSEELTNNSESFTETEVGFESEPEELVTMDYPLGVGGWYTVDELNGWQRTPGPKRVGIQVGHLDNEEVPEELSGLTRNGAGAVAAGYTEREVNALVAEIVAEQLRAEGVVVDVLPAVVPPKYEADAFISIHADGNNNSGVRGFKMAGPRRDYSGASQALVDALYESYAESTGLPIDGNISRRMTAYYAFNWARYEHAVHPYTPSAIVEMGFLTNATDRSFMLNRSEEVATGIASGVLSFLESYDPERAPRQVLENPELPLIGEVRCAPVREERRNRPTRPCEASLFVDDRYYMLVAEPAIATSSLPYQATVTGEYRPVQMLPNYFWFHYEVEGLIYNPVIEQLSAV
jgi:N-acetylmuramoyl-L-alanine amidase